MCYTKQQLGVNSRQELKASSRGKPAILVKNQKKLKIQFWWKQIIKIMAY